MKKTTSQILIENLSKKRYEYIKQRENSWNEEKEEYEIDPSEIDELANQIQDLIKSGRYELPFEFIIEELTKLGDAPCIFYDDNGHFAISGDGYCSVSLEVDDWEGTFFVEKSMWKDSMREALDYYLDYEDDE